MCWNFDFEIHLGFYLYVTFHTFYQKNCKSLENTQIFFYIHMWVSRLNFQPLEELRNNFLSKKNHRIFTAYFDIINSYTINEKPLFSFKRCTCPLISEKWKKKEFLSVRYLNTFWRYWWAMKMSKHNGTGLSLLQSRISYFFSKVLEPWIYFTAFWTYIYLCSLAV